VSKAANPFFIVGFLFFINWGYDGLLHSSIPVKSLRTSAAYAAAPPFAIPTPTVATVPKAILSKSLSPPRYSKED